MNNQEWFVKAAAIAIELDLIEIEIRKAARKAAFNRAIEAGMPEARARVQAMHEAVAKSRRS